MIYAYHSVVYCYLFEKDTIHETPFGAVRVLLRLILFGQSITKEVTSINCGLSAVTLCSKVSEQCSETRCYRKAGLPACLYCTDSLQTALNMGGNMKRLSVFVSVLVMLFAVNGAFAADELAISGNVDAIVASIEKGTDVSTIKADSVEPYVFVMEENGKMLVHPTLAGESLKEKAPPVYDALMKASPEGVWVQYEWGGKMKHTYAKRTSGNLIVGSGY